MVCLGRAWRKSSVVGCTLGGCQKVQALKVTPTSPILAKKRRFMATIVAQPRLGLHLEHVFFLLFEEMEPVLYQLK